MKISIAEDFSDVPSGRRPADGPFSAEVFREQYLAPNMKKASPSDPLIVNLNGAEGYPSNFLEEAFGGLVAKHGFTADQLHKSLKIEAENGYKTYRAIIWIYIDEARPASR